MADLEVDQGIESHPPGGDRSRSAPALTKQRAEGLNPGSSGGKAFGQGLPVDATVVPSLGLRSQNFGVDLI